MPVDPEWLGHRSSAVFAGLGDKLRGRLGALWLKPEHFSSESLPFSAVMSIGHDVNNPDEDLAVSIDLMPDCRWLRVCIAWGDGKIVAEQEFPITTCSNDDLAAAMDSAEEFFDLQLDALVKALRVLDR